MKNYKFAQLNRNGKEQKIMNAVKKTLIVVPVLMVLASTMVTYAAEINGPTKVVNASIKPGDKAREKKKVYSSKNYIGGGALISDDNYVDYNDYQKSLVFLGTKSVTKNRAAKAQISWYSLSGTTYRYEQLDPYYCVPATMQTILRYNNNSLPPTQDTIASEMGFTSGVGVDFLNVPDYLNNHQTKNTYVLHSKFSKSQMKSKIKTDISSLGVPTCIRISVSNSSDWFYTTSGHALVCNSITTDSGTVQLVDPGVGYSWYSKSTDDLYKVFTHLAW